MNAKEVGLSEGVADQRPLRVAFVTQHDKWPWARQLPAGKTCVDSVEFFVPIAEADVVFVYDALPDIYLEVPSSAHKVFICSEPEDIKRYNNNFLAQFDAVITTDKCTLHPNKIFIQPGLPWHVGSMTEGGELLTEPMLFEDLERHHPRKTRLISVVASDKMSTEAQRARLAFVAKLKDAFGDQIDVYGRGITDFGDKRDVLDSYRYHIALENCAVKDYWTEKLADSFLTLTFPIYYGCPNILDYFSRDALRSIDIYKPDEAIAVIKNIIDSGLAERSYAELLEARRKVMNQYNVFFLMARIARNYVSDASSSRISLGDTVVIQYEMAFASTLTRRKDGLIRLLVAVPGLYVSVRAVKRILRSVFLSLKRVK